MGYQALEKGSPLVSEHQTSAPNGHTLLVTRCRLKALKSSLVHIFPLAVTIGILQLSLFNYYWGDADEANQRVKIAALQVGAKVHEILILVSLSSMVLHYTHKLLVAPEGISFGLLAAAYQSGLSSNPWTIGNWEAIKQLRNKHKKSTSRGRSVPDHGSKANARLLVTLLVILAFLALFIGPASAITLIPQLSWWHRQDLVGPLQRANNYISPSFTVYVPTKLFPTEVDDSRLPGPFCGDAAKDINGTCPSARIAEVAQSLTFRSSGFDFKTQNVTIQLGEEDRVIRRMLYKQSEQIAAVTVSNYLLASFASLIRLPTFPNAGNKDVGGPFTLEIYADDAPPLNPLVGAVCEDATSNLFVRNFTYDLDGFAFERESEKTFEDVRKLATLDIRTIWNEDELKRNVNGTEFVWRDVTNTTVTPVLLGLLKHGRNVTVCTVQSYWTPTSQWVLSSSNYDIATNFTFEDPRIDPQRVAFSSKYGYPYYLNTRNIHIQESWANMLNTMNGSTKVLDNLLQSGITALEDDLSKRNTNTTSEFSREYKYFETTISQLLAKTVANGLSRIGAQYAADRFIDHISLNNLTICNQKTRWCSEGPFLTARYMPLAVTANTSREESYLYHRPGSATSNSPSWFHDPNPIMRSFPMPVNAEEMWTRIDFPVRKYGYGYAFQGVTTYLAATLLCFHAIIVVVHVVYRVAFDAQNYEFGGSLGSLLLLAMGDRVAAGDSTWKKRVAVVSPGDMVKRKPFKLEVMEDDGLENEEKMQT